MAFWVGKFSRQHSETSQSQSVGQESHCEKAVKRQGEKVQWRDQNRDRVCICTTYIRWTSPVKPVISEWARSGILGQIPDPRELTVVQLVNELLPPVNVIFLTCHLDDSALQRGHRRQPQSSSPALSVLLQAPPLIMPGCRCLCETCTLGKEGAGKEPVLLHLLWQFLDKLLATEPRSERVTERQDQNPEPLHSRPPGTAVHSFLNIKVK